MKMPLDAARRLRPSWVELDGDAVAANVARARECVGPDRKIYFVCKGDGFGFGAAWVARQAVDAGVDAICVGSPEEAVSIREADVKCDILLFASTLPEQAAQVAQLDVTVTLHSPESIEAYAKLGKPVEAFVEVDCGFGRFGLARSQWAACFARLRDLPQIRLRGLYGHLSSPEDAKITGDQSGIFDEAHVAAKAAGFDALELVLASSRVMILHPQLSYTGVDPGRLIYGALDAPYMRRAKLRPLLAAVRSRVIHVQEHAAGAVLGLGYGAPLQLTEPVRLGVIPIGFWDGLNHVPPLGDVLLHGRRARVVGRRSFQHTVIDITDIPEAKVGSVATLVGRDGPENIEVDELAEVMRLPVMELVPRLARSLPHVVTDAAKPSTDPRSNT
jgi:alanine racemase